MNVKFYLSWDCNNYYEEVKNDLENGCLDEDDADNYQDWYDYVYRKLHEETKVNTLEELGAILTELDDNNCPYQVEYYNHEWVIMIDCY